MIPKLEQMLEIKKIAPFSENERRKISRLPLESSSTAIDLIENIPKGTYLGNHYHNFKKEIFFVKKGSFELKVEDIETKRRARGDVIVGDLITMPVKIAHQFYSLQASELLAESNSQESAAMQDPDIIKYEFNW